VISHFHEKCAGVKFCAKDFPFPFAQNCALLFSTAHQLETTIKIQKMIVFPPDRKSDFAF
jgi:hypothetical protein